MASTKNETKKAADGQMAAANISTVSAEQMNTGKVQPDDIAEKGRNLKEKKESVYSTDEFCTHAQELFHTKPECVRAALSEKNVTQCSKAEAKQIVKAFMKKEVK